MRIVIELADDAATRVATSTDERRVAIGYLLSLALARENISPSKVTFQED